MKKPRRKVYRGRRQRIYYGRDKVSGQRLFYQVYVTDAKESIKIKGSSLHAMLGVPNQSVGCTLSNCGYANKEVFPHPVVYMPSFSAAACLVPDEIRDGQLYHAVRYEHDYGNLVDMNDKGAIQEYVRQHPEVMEREFTLRAPKRKQKQSKKASGKHHPPTAPIPESAHKIPRGSLRRAVASGMLPKGIEQSLMDE